MRQRIFIVVVALMLGLSGQSFAQATAPTKPNSVRLAVIGDMGTGGSGQYEVAAQMIAAHKVFPFDFVLMVGDNIYGGSDSKDIEKKFSRPYKALLDAGVKFYASLGNHDNPNERFYEPYNMNGENYYTFRKGNVRFFALDSNYMDPKQLAWIEKELNGAGTGDWKICYFHHPLYSSGKTHGPSTDLRLLLEPLFVKAGVDAVFAGHEHFYERIKPQQGIYYFIEGSSGQLRRDNLKKTPITEKGFDADNTFMLVEFTDAQLNFQTISRAGKTVDSGTLVKRKPPEKGQPSESQSAAPAPKAASATPAQRN